MAPKNVGINSTFEQQRQVINQIAVDVDNLSNSGFLTSANLVGYATETYVNNAIVGFITSGASGSNLTGIVTYITAGAGISITQSTGNVTIAATGGGGGTQTLNQTLGYGNTSSLGMSVGVSTFNTVVVGGATTALIVNGNARITGILTLGTASIELVARDSHLKIGTGVSIYEAGNAIYSGIVTAPAFYGNGSNLTGLVTSITAGSGISINQTTGNVTITATGGGGSGIALTDLSVTVSSPGISTLTYNNTTGAFNYTPPNLTGYATTESVVGFITSGALTGYATETYVNNAVVGFITSGALTGYATEGYVDNAISQSSNFATPLASNTLGDLFDQVFKFQYSVATAVGTISTIQSGQNYGYLAFTHANEIVVSSGSTLHISSGTTFKLNFLNIF